MQPELKLQVLRHNADCMTKELAQICQEIQDIEMFIIALDGTFKGTKFDLGFHTCLTSPIGFCIYNSEEDPCHDNCVRCGLPEERK